MKLTNAFIVSTILFSTFVTQAFSEDLPKGNETGNRDISAEALEKMIKEGAVYKIDKADKACPPIIQLKQFDGKSFTNGRKVGKGDIAFSLYGFKEEKNELEYDHFTHENNRFVFKPTLKGKSKNLSDGCSLGAGIGCRSDYQQTTKESVVFEGRVRHFVVFSLLEMGLVSMDTSVVINTEKNTISYTYTGNDIDDINCSYKIAPSGLKSKVASYSAQKEAEDLAYEKKMLSTNDTNRSAVKEVDHSADVKDNSSSKVQSK